MVDIIGHAKRFPKTQFSKVLIFLKSPIIGRINYRTSGSLVKAGMASTADLSARSIFHRSLTKLGINATEVAVSAIRLKLLSSLAKLQIEEYLIMQSQDIGLLWKILKHPRALKDLLKIFPESAARLGATATTIAVEGAVFLVIVLFSSAQTHPDIVTEEFIFDQSSLDLGLFKLLHSENNINQREPKDLCHMSDKLEVAIKNYITTPGYTFSGTRPLREKTVPTLFGTYKNILTPYILNEISDSSTQSCIKDQLARLE